MKLFLHLPFTTFQVGLVHNELVHLNPIVFDTLISGVLCGGQIHTHARDHVLKRLHLLFMTDVVRTKQNEKDVIGGSGLKNKCTRQKTKRNYYSFGKGNSVSSKNIHTRYGESARMLLIYFKKLFQSDSSIMFYQRNCITIYMRNNIVLFLSSSSDDIILPPSGFIFFKTL